MASPLPFTQTPYTHPPPQLCYPLKADRSSSTKADGLWVRAQLLPPKLSKNQNWNIPHSKHWLGSKTRSLSTPNQPFWEQKITEDILIWSKWLCCPCMALCSWLHTSSKRFSKYKGQSSPQHHWSAAEIGHLTKPPAFKYPLPKPENDDYCSPSLIISFLSQRRNIKRERP